jgi:hypothetical protein
MNNNQETKVIKLRDFKPENIRFSSLRTTKHGGKVVYINYDYEDNRSPKPLRIQMPKMKTPFGISGWDTSRLDKKDSSPTENSNDTLELSIGDNHEIVEKFEQMDLIIISQAVENSKEYFKKKYAEDYIKMQYKSAIKFNENEDGERDTKYPPRLKTKLYKDSEFVYKTQVFNTAKELLKIDVYNYLEILPKGSECVTLLECAGIWIINEKFGVSWRPAQMKVYKSDTKLSGYSFIDDEAEDQEEDNNETEEDNNETEELSEKLEEVKIETTEEPVTVLDDDLDPLEENVAVVAKKVKKTKK